MKKNISFTCFVLLLTCVIQAQQPDYRVIFDMTSKDSLNQQTLIRELGLIRDGNPDAKMEVVVYAHGLDLVVKNRTSQESALTRLLADKNIAVKVCAITLERNNVDKSQLIPGVEVVPDGIYEIITKQREGWGYIKVGR